MASRLNLQQTLETILGNRRVYFSPPETIKLVYPCIVYTLRGSQVKYADDSKYFKYNQYDVTLIDSNPDSDYVKSIENGLKYCELDSVFTQNNLSHFLFTVYY